MRREIARLSRTDDEDLAVPTITAGEQVWVQLEIPLVNRLNL